MGDGYGNIWKKKSDGIHCIATNIKKCHKVFSNKTSTSTIGKHLKDVHELKN